MLTAKEAKQIADGYLTIENIEELIDSAAKNEGYSISFDSNWFLFRNFDKRTDLHDELKEAGYELSTWYAEYNCSIKCFKISWENAK